MRNTVRHAATITAGGVLLATVMAIADGTRFSDFTPLTASAGPTLDEGAPITFGNADTRQRSIAARATQLAELKPNSGAWDMITINETGPDKGRYLFTVFGDGNTPNATGAYAWVPFTDARGNALPGALTIVDTNGVRSVDARNTTNLAPFKGTDYQRPEDMQIQRLHGDEYLYVTTTTTHEVYRLDLKRQTISVFVNRNTIDLATGAPVGSGLANPDNLAVDHDGNIYVIEDRNGGVDDDIWFAKDLNDDGDLNDEGEGIARWASNGTVGSEFTGLYFDPTNKRRAWVNIQHPASGNDRTIEITIR